MTKNDMYREIGENIRSILDEYGMSQKELADELDISKQAVSAFISGERKIPIDIIVNIAYILDCDITDLVMVDEMIN